MRLLILSNVYPPLSHGGAEQIAFRTAKELVRRGHQVSVLTTRPLDRLDAFFVRKDRQTLYEVYRFFPLNLYHLSSASRRPFALRIPWHLIDLWSPQAGKVVASLVDRIRPQAVITHNLKGLGFQAVPALARLKIPHVHVLHDVQLSVPSGALFAGEERKGLNGSLLRGWYESRMRRVMGSPDLVLSPSRFLLDFHKQRGFFPKSRTAILQNPAPEPKGALPSFVTSPVLQMFYAGRLEKHKGLLFLLESLEGLQVPFHLHLAGDGSLREYVTEFVKRDARVTYHGLLTSERLMELLAECQVSVVPSLCYENSPMAVYESFAAGVPVLASDIGGIPELVQPGMNGYVFTTGNRQAFAEAVAKFYGERETFLARAGEIQEAVRPYSLTRHVDALEGYVRELVEKTA